MSGLKHQTPTTKLEVSARSVVGTLDSRKDREKSIVAGKGGKLAQAVWNAAVWQEPDASGWLELYSCNPFYYYHLSNLFDKMLWWMIEKSVRNLSEQKQKRTASFFTDVHSATC